MAPPQPSLTGEKAFVPLLVPVARPPEPPDQEEPLYKQIASPVTVSPFDPSDLPSDFSLISFVAIGTTNPIATKTKITKVRRITFVLFRRTFV